jgi:hypothetical protein
MDKETSWGALRDNHPIITFPLRGLLSAVFHNSIGVPLARPDINLFIIVRCHGSRVSRKEEPPCEQRQGETLAQTVTKRIA